jgi:hypothetical protein
MTEVANQYNKQLLNIVVSTEADAEKFVKDKLCEQGLKGE